MKPRDENVLFDADDEDFEEDFGDFEAVSCGSPYQLGSHTSVAIPEGKGWTSSTKQDLTLVDLVEEPVKDGSQRKENQPAASVTAANNAPRLGSSFRDTERTDSMPGASPDRLQSSVGLEEDFSWLDFSHEPHGREPSAHPQPSHIDPQREVRNETATNPQREVQIDFPDLLGGSKNLSAASPPTNIPPPALLFTLFAPIFNVAQERLFGPLSRHGNASPTRAAILYHSATRNFLASLSVIGTVLGHTIAGRKLRWKRDTILNQSMRIGPATASRSGGMKLATLDQSESAKEDREVADAVRAWRSVAGRLRSAVGQGKTLPEMAEDLPVRTALQNEGAILSTKSCALCGLKRNERVQKIDYDIQDSFGEWYGVTACMLSSPLDFKLTQICRWVEHWGHRACLNFWDAQSANLKAR